MANETAPPGRGARRRAGPADLLASSYGLELLKFRPAAILSFRIGLPLRWRVWWRTSWCARC